MNDLIALAISFVLVGFAAGAAYILDAVLRAPSAVSRKACHTIMSLWVFIMVYMMESAWARAAGPLIFVFINAAIPRTKAGRAISRSRIDTGLISFPLSLLILSLLYSYGYAGADAVISAVLIMGFGDAGAAMTGIILGKEKKSLAGSAAMTMISFIIVLAFTELSLPAAASAALAAALIEHITPSGFDNLSVPVIMTLLLEVLCSL